MEHERRRRRLGRRRTVGPSLRSWPGTEGSMRALASRLAAALLGIGLAGCAVRGGPAYSPYDGWGYAEPSPYYYGASPFAFGYPYRRYDDRYVDRAPLSRKQVLNGLDRRGYGDFQNFERRRGAYFVEAEDKKGRRVILKVNPYTGRVVDIARD